MKYFIGLFVIIGCVGIIIRFVYASKAKARRMDYDYHETLNNVRMYQKKALVTAVITFLVLCLLWFVILGLHIEPEAIMLTLTCFNIGLIAWDLFQLRDDEDKYFRF